MTKEYRDAVISAAAGQTLSEIITDEQSSFECETEECAYNHNGYCRYKAVNDELPVITEEQGCLSGIMEDIHNI